MATSSIFADFNVYDSVKADAFIDALGKAEKASAKRPFVSSGLNTLTDVQEISALIKNAAATVKKDKTGRE
ncbi:MAG: hypothetical protein Q4E34_06340 [Synergistaceae bacterium]|nr:hypothetical protein [Synergistaceae bacterium]